MITEYPIRSPWRPNKASTPQPLPRGHPLEDEEAIRSLHCSLCDVSLGDRESMRSHIAGEHCGHMKRKFTYSKEVDPRKRFNLYPEFGYGKMF